MRPRQWNHRLPHTARMTEQLGIHSLPGEWPPITAYHRRSLDVAQLPDPYTRIDYPVPRCRRCHLPRCSDLPPEHCSTCKAATR